MAQQELCPPFADKAYRALEHIADQTVAFGDLSAHGIGQDLVYQRHEAGPYGHGAPGSVGRGGHQHHAALADCFLDDQRVARLGGQHDVGLRPLGQHQLEIF